MVWELRNFVPFQPSGGRRIYIRPEFSHGRKFRRCRVTTFERAGWWYDQFRVLIPERYRVRREDDFYFFEKSSSIAVAMRSATSAISGCPSQRDSEVMPR